MKGMYNLRNLVLQIIYYIITFYNGDKFLVVCSVTLHSVYILEK